jgi:hypothetical protein
MFGPVLALQGISYQFSMPSRGGLFCICACAILLKPVVILRESMVQGISGEKNPPVISSGLVELAYHPVERL